MKTSLFLVACIGAAFTLSLGGCSYISGQSSPVSHKQTASQPTTYKSPPANKPNVSVPPAPYQSVTPVSSAPGRIKAAILLPLSGRNAALGQAMLNAAQQAVFDSAGTNFELQPHDTASDGGAEEAARLAVSNGAQLIIGPLFATDVPAVKMIAQSQGLQVLPLSTDTSLAERGVYVMGLAPAAQVDRIVAFAAAQGAHNFAALVPSTPYGTLVGQEFRSAVAQQGGQVVDMEAIASSGPQGQQIQNLAAQRDHIDALFLPESGNELSVITDMLVSAQFDPARIHMLGTGLWDVPDLGHQNVLLSGGWYAAPDPAMRRNFIVSYKSIYGQEPPRLATLAYDATALAAVIAKRGGHYDETALTNPNGFAGLDGIFRLTPSGVVERALAVNEVTHDGARVIDPAPTSFIGKAH